MSSLDRDADGVTCSLFRTHGSFLTRCLFCVRLSCWGWAGGASPGFVLAGRFALASVTISLFLGCF